MEMHFLARLISMAVILLMVLRAAQPKISLYDDDDDESNKIEDILPHYAGDQHLDSFDQTLFIGGKQKASDFRKLPEEERKKIFAKIVTLVDVNADGLIDKDELTDWMYEALVTVDKEDTIESMEPIDVNQDRKVSWFEYHDHVYGYMPGDDEEENKEEHQKYIRRAKRTYDIADMDGDGFLNAKEFHMFHNPKFYREMERVVVSDSLEDFDTNGDGGIDITEFIGDFHTVDEEEDIPQWVLEEKHMFETELDHDGNGKLEGNEIFELESQEKSLRAQAEREVDHLLAMTDSNADNHLSLEEAVESEILFMGRDQHTHFNRNPNIIVQHNEL
ncbi:calumenin-B-like [Diadema antillarum]|uniref:calumenin-B-like n=1 Tax=Diadema antillarum TaxID=105358 RepID=UPI003A83FC1C